MRILKVRLGFFVCFALFFPAISLATTHNLARYNTMLELTDPNQAHIIWKGGQWQYNGMSGFTQVIYTQHPFTPKGEKDAQVMQLQWVRTDHDQSELIYQVAVNEFNHSPNFNFSKPKCLEISNCQTFSLVVYSSYEESSFNFNLTIGGLGQYNLKPSSRQIHASL